MLMKNKFSNLQTPHFLWNIEKNNNDKYNKHNKINGSLHVIDCDIKTVYISMVDSLH